MSPKNSFAGVSLALLVKSRD
jgi:hypothetical protein